ncbi:MAG: type II secretion system protein GspG [Phycisphaerales bacterium]|nr:type II secretion system protein GspG [Phycisphaerales bacterium]
MNTNRTRRQRRRQRGFSLLEVIVAVTIIALLATIVIPKVWDNIGRSKQKIAKAEVNSLANQVRIYLADHDVSAIESDFSLEELALGEQPYVNSENDLLDPWGRPYVIVVPGVVNRDFDIMSFGADGEAGGEGENADVVNGR